MGMTETSAIRAPAVTALGAGPVDGADLARCLELAPILVAADGGCTTALRMGVMPDLVVGDLDSLPAETASGLPPSIVRHVPDQDSTDFEKCLSAIDADLILGAGFLGGRIDHSLAALNALVRDGRRIVLLGEHDLVLALPDRMSLDLPPESRLSLFPLARVSGRSRGLRWPIDGIRFAPDGLIGTSNEATGPATIETDAPGLLLVMPRAALDAVLDVWLPAARAR